MFELNDTEQLYQLALEIPQAARDGLRFAVHDRLHERHPQYGERS